MSDAKKVPGLYQRLTSSGAVLRSFSGVRAAIATGSDPAAASATWNVEAATIDGLKPRAGDLMRGADGAWWVVAAVGALANGSYPCTCDRKPE
jgi:hypothetical protein